MQKKKLFSQHGKEFPNTMTESSNSNLLGVGNVID
jgi:hypothetical protein